MGIQCVDTVSIDTMKKSSAVVANSPQFFLTMCGSSTPRISLEKILTNEEQSLRDRVAPHKLLDWLLGRYAAKHAIAGVLEKYGGVYTPVTSIGILSGLGKAPEYRIVGDLGDEYTYGDAVRFSIAHSEGVAVALALPETACTHIGVDIERVRVFKDETIRGFLTLHEYATYMKLPSSTQAEYVTELWCIKESFLKAIGTGLRVHPRNVEVTRDVRTNRTDVTYCGVPVRKQCLWTTKIGGYMIATIRI